MHGLGRMDFIPEDLQTTVVQFFEFVTALIGYIIGLIWRKQIPVNEAVPGGTRLCTHWKELKKGVGVDVMEGRVRIITIQRGHSALQKKIVPVWLAWPACCQKG